MLGPLDIAQGSWGEPDSKIFRPRQRFLLTPTLSTLIGDVNGNRWHYVRPLILHTRFLTKCINHQEAYSDGEASTNMAESFFSRLRRAEIGTHHHIAGPYLAAYAAEMAWREDNRRVSNGEQYLMTAEAGLRHSVSRQWKGYWQRFQLSTR